MDFETILEKWESSKEGKKVAKSHLLHKERDHRTSQPNRGYLTGNASLKRLRRMECEAELDLHGYTQHEAEQKIIEFLSESVSQQLRKVRIIHGRGLHSPEGVSLLKDVAHRVLSQSRYVREYTQAPSRKGGSGATWVILQKGS
ncbi:MAG: Smr/MutS family protein [Sphaerochaetaceae bacterium]|jgi:DNA-nicking Smr family endonuclease